MEVLRWRQLACLRGSGWKPGRRGIGSSLSYNRRMRNHDLHDEDAIQGPQLPQEHEGCGEFSTGRKDTMRTPTVFPESLGFRSGAASAHTSRTMMLQELTLVLNHVSPNATQAAYRRAIIEDNVLGKPTQTTRQRSAKRLAELYALDPNCTLFRLLRHFWPADRHRTADAGFPPGRCPRSTSPRGHAACASGQAGGDRDGRGHR